MKAFFLSEYLPPDSIRRNLLGFCSYQGGGGNGSQLSLDRDKSFSTLIWDRGRDKSGSGSREVKTSQGQVAERSCRVRVRKQRSGCDFFPLLKNKKGQTHNHSTRAGKVREDQPILHIFPYKIKC